MDLLDISYLELLWKYVQKIPNLVKIKQKYWTLYTKTEAHYIAASDIKLLPLSEMVSGC